MGLLGKQDILDADDLPTRDVSVVEWGGDVRVRGMNGTERDRFEMQMVLAKQNGTMAEVDIRASTVGRCMVDENGARLFTDKELGRLAKKSAAALDRVFEAVKDLSGMNADDAEVAAEGFDAAPGGSSPSD